MKPFKTILSLALAFLVLLSSSSFMIGIHFCSGEINNIGFLTRAEKCEMEQKLPPCHRHMMASCCDDETIVHKGEELKNPVTQLKIDSPVTGEFAAVPTVISEIIPSVPAARIAYNSYDPPLRWIDITITHQVLLI